MCIMASYLYLRRRHRQTPPQGQRAEVSWRS
jgi:hypothetical protein